MSKIPSLAVRILPARAAHRDLVHYRVAVLCRAPADQAARPGISGRLARLKESYATYVFPHFLHSTRFSSWILSAVTEISFCSFFLLIHRLPLPLRPGRAVARGEAPHGAGWLLCHWRAGGSAVALGRQATGVNVESLFWGTLFYPFLSTKHQEVSHTPPPMAGSRTGSWCHSKSFVG